MGQPLLGLFDKQFNTLGNALAARERMQSVYAANIANADTPNYHADTRSFADFLAQKQAQTSGGSQLAVTEPGHIAGGSNPSWMDVPVTRNNQAQRLDGNSVNIQKSMTEMAQNQMMYDMTLRIVKKDLDGLSSVIREASR